MIENPSFILFMLIGFCAGTTSGFYGMGGGWLVTPILNVIGFPMPYAIGTSLVYIVINSIVGTLRHKKFKNVNYLLGLLIGVNSIIGVLIGKSLISYMKKAGNVDVVVRYIYIIFLLSVSLYMLFERKIKSKKLKRKSGRVKRELPPVIKIKVEGKIRKISIWKLLITGILLGMLSSMMGIGGGFLLVPIYIYLIRVPVKVAVGTSLFTTLITSISGSVAYIFAGWVNWFSLIFLVATTIIGVFIGTSATHRVSSERLKLLFALTILGACVSVIFKQLNFNLYSKITIFTIAALSPLIIIYFGFIRTHLRELSS